MTDGPSCAICSIGKLAHEKAEFLRTVHHRWSANGELTLITATPRPQTQPTPVIANAADVQLRAILINKGLLSDGDFVPLPDPGQGADGDLRTGDAKGTG